MVRRALLLVVLMLIHRTLWGAAEPALENFAALLGKSPVTGKPVRDLEELLPLLSDELRSNFTFVYDSRSPHKVDPLHPRTILFTKDGRLALAFTGNPNQPGYNVLETISFDDAGARFNLRQYVLPAAGGSADNGRSNPPQCLRCHGADPKPITDSYPLWPGFYGSVRDTFPPDSQELPFYRRFLKTAAKQGVYRHLKFPRGTSVPPYLDPKHYRAGKVEAGTDVLRLQPNTRLGMAWTELNRKRIQRKLEASPLYASRKYALLAGLLDCRPLPLMAGAEDQTYTRLHYENEDRLARLGYRPLGPAKKGLDMMEMAMYPALAQVTYLGEALEVDASDWPLAFEHDSLSYFDGILSGMLGEKSFYAKEDFIHEMLRRLAETEPAFRPYYQTSGAYTDSGYPFGTRLDLAKAVRACGLLQKRARAHPPLPRQKPKMTHVLPPAESILAHAGLDTIPFARCQRCHEGPEAVDSGRRIPFSDPAALVEALRSQSKSGQTLMKEILVRVQSEGEGQMPPRGERFDAREVAQLRAYLSAVDALAQ